MKRFIFVLGLFIVFSLVLVGCESVTTPGNSGSVLNLKTFQDDNGYFSLLVPEGMTLDNSRITDSSVFYWLKDDKHTIMITLVNVSKDPNYLGVTTLSEFVQTILQQEQNFVQDLVIVSSPTSYKDGMKTEVSFKVNGVKHTTYHFDKKVKDNLYVDLEVKIGDGIDEGIFSQIVDSLKVLKTL